MIRWKPEEITKVATRVIAISRASGKSALGHYGYGRTIFEAQSVLSASRQRPLQSVTGEKNQKALKEEVQKLVAAEHARDAEKTKALASAAKPDAPKPVEAKTTASTDSKVIHLDQIGKNLATPSTPFVPREVEPEPDDLKAFAGMGLEQMFETAARAMAVTLAQAFVGEIRKQFANELPMLAARANNINKKLPKILVIGPLARQQPMLESAIDGVVELKFVSSEERASLVTERGKYCVGAVLWTQHINHSHTEAVQRIFSSQNIRWVSGTNLEAMKGELEDLALHFNH
jgi:hypothetical protein